jgi:hypothetical protein
MREQTRSAIEAEITTLQAEIETLKSQGEYYLEAWVSGSKPSGKNKSYPRVQSRIAQFGGAKVRHIRQDESVPMFQAMCDRGQQIGKAMKAIDRLQKRLDS